MVWGKGQYKASVSQANFNLKNIYIYETKQEGKVFAFKKTKEKTPEGKASDTNNRF